MYQLPHHSIGARQVRCEGSRVLPNYRAHGRAEPRDGLKVVHRLEGDVAVDKDAVHDNHRSRFRHFFRQLPLTLVSLRGRARCRARVGLDPWAHDGGHGQRDFASTGVRFFLVIAAAMVAFSIGFFS